MLSVGMSRRGEGEGGGGVPIKDGSRRRAAAPSNVPSSRARTSRDRKQRRLMQMTPVGFEPTQLALVELESTPLDHSGKLSCLVDKLQGLQVARPAIAPTAHGQRNRKNKRLS